MHLDQTVLVVCGAVDDEEDIVAVLVQLRSLAEVLRILDRERMELEHITQHLEVVRLGLMEVEPEKAAGRE